MLPTMLQKTIESCDINNQLSRMVKLNVRLQTYSSYCNRGLKQGQNLNVQRAYYNVISS